MSDYVAIREDGRWECPHCGGQIDTFADSETVASIVTAAVEAERRRTARAVLPMPDPTTDRLAALLTEHVYGAGSQGRYCRCGAMGTGDRQKNHVAHVAAVLTENGVGFTVHRDIDHAGDEK